MRVKLQYICVEYVYKLNIYTQNTVVHDSKNMFIPVSIRLPLPLKLHIPE